MQIQVDGEFIAGIIKRAYDLGDSIDEAVDNAMSGTGIGMASPNKEELARFFFKMQEQFPPEDWITPAGQRVHASPWILLLGEAEGGDEWLKKWHQWNDENKASIPQQSPVSAQMQSQVTQSALVPPVAPSATQRPLNSRVRSKRKK